MTHSPKIVCGQDQIDRAIRQNSAKCVAALGIADKVRDATNINVDMQTMRYSRDGKRYVYLTPPLVQQYVIAFDAGDPIEPFAFHLPKAVQVLDLRPTTNAAGRPSNARSTEAPQPDLVSSPSSPTTRSNPELAIGAERVAEAPTTRSDPGPAFVMDGNQHMTQLRGRPLLGGRVKRTYGARTMRINQDRFGLPVTHPGGLPAGS